MARGSPGAGTVRVGKLMSVSDVAAVCAVSPRTVRRWLKGGDHPRLNHYRIKNVVRVSLDDLTTFLLLNREGDE